MKTILIKFHHELVIATLLIMVAMTVKKVSSESFLEADNYIGAIEYSMKKQPLAEGSICWKDSLFEDYENRAKIYLKRDVFIGTPVKAKMLAKAARKAFDSTNVLVPVELCLAQCQFESGMGLRGRSPSTNPFNVGEFDAGTMMRFKNTTHGVQAYFFLMCNDYLQCKDIDELFSDFTNCKGYRYASAPYENMIPPQFHFIKDWINNRLENNQDIALARQ